MPTKRIAYIDAMRGFTMILVVYSHVCGFCLGNRSMGFNDVLFLFRLPCFFFISGWLFYKAGRVWNRQTVRQVVSRKFMVQIVPTFIFLLLLVTVHDGQSPMVFFSRLGATKGGYWFTFALFEFFVIYILSALPFRKRSGEGLQLCIAVAISALAFCYDVYYHQLTLHLSPFTPHLSPLTILGFLSFMTWRYYLFFYIGTLVKRHFETFVAWTDKPLVMVGVFFGFVAVALVPHSDAVVREYLVFAIGGVCGMTLVFTLFRRLSPLISHFSPLTLVGRRTLDIYLLHYFFLPRFLLSYGEQLRSYDNPLLESVVALLLALLVTAVCVLVSSLIRLSPFLGHYLFGVDYEKKQ